MHLQLKKTKTDPTIAPLSLEALEWQLKLFYRKKNMDTSKMNELQFLSHKASFEGLTYDEKQRFKMLQQNKGLNIQVSCGCYRLGENCKIHGSNLYHYEKYS